MSDPSSRPLHCDFYRIAHKGPMDFPTAVDALFDERPSAQDRNLTVPDGFVRIAKWQQRHGANDGVLIRTRQSLKHVASAKTDEMYELELGDGEALAESCCFYFHPEYQVLVTERNLQAGGPRRIIDYLNTQVGSHLQASMLLTRKGVEELDRLTEITFLDITVAVPDQLSFYDEYNESVAKAIGHLRDLEAKRITVRLSLGPGKPAHGLNAANVRKAILGVLGLPSQARKLEVHGYYLADEQKERLELDLVKQRLQASTEVPCNASFDVVTAALRQAYKSVRPIVAEQIAPTD